MRPRFLCVGSALWDTIAQVHKPLSPGDDMPGRIEKRMGGVALNIALKLAETGRNAEIVAYIGWDAAGAALVDAISHSGVGTRYLTRGKDPTDGYLAVENPGGEVFAAVADCAALERAGLSVLAPIAAPQEASPSLPYTDILIADGNLPEEVLHRLFALPRAVANRPILVPASPGKAARLTPIIKAHGGRIYVNRHEAEIILGKRLLGAAEAAEQLLDLGAEDAIVTDGAAPLAQAARSGPVRVHTPPQVVSRSTTGAGDVFLAAHLSAEADGSPPQEALEAAAAMAAAHITKAPKR